MIGGESRRSQRVGLPGEPSAATGPSAALTWNAPFDLAPQNVDDVVRRERLVRLERVKLTDFRGQRDVVNAAIASSDVGVRLQSIQQELDHAEQARKQALQRRSRIEGQNGAIPATNVS